MAKWIFRTYDGLDDASQTSSAEAFEGPAIKNLATCVVRESIQNVLDAQQDPSQPVRVRFALIEEPTRPNATSHWFAELFKHLHAPQVRLPDPPQGGDRCRFMVIEDFNTRGLIGDYLKPFVPGEENNFFNFLYHDGITGKSGQKLGSRGVGKIVLWLASRARTVFAYTIRAGEAPKPLLVGKTLLKLRVVDGQSYRPAGYYVESWEPERPRQPVTDASELAAFHSDFKLARGAESGLSVVVPFVDQSISIDDIRRAIVEEFYFAILGGRLVVEVVVDGRTEAIHANRIPDVGDPELAARIDLARYAMATPVPELSTKAPQPGVTQKLTEDLVDEHVRKAVLTALTERKRVAVRCHLFVHPQESAPEASYFDVYIEHAEGVRARPTFMRDLLQISGVGQSCSQVRSLVFIRPGPLADLLRAAEGANHMQWSAFTENFKKAYKARKSEIDFVTRSVNRLIEIAQGDASEPVGGISTDFFPLRFRDAARQTKGANKHRPGARPERPDIPELEPKPLGYRFSEHAGGFTIRGIPDEPVPTRITARVAYDVIRGSPWADYDNEDFDFRDQKGEVRVLASDALVERPDPGNRLVIRPKSSAFEVIVTGFNEHLDLIVEHRSERRRARKDEGDLHAGQKTQLH